MLVGLMIFMAAFIKCCAVHTPSNNPKKKPALRISDTLRRPADTLRRKRHRQTHSGGGHHQATRGSSSTPSGTAIPLQASAPDIMGPSLYPHSQHPLPAPPSSSSGGGNSCHTNFQVHSSSSGGMNSQHHQPPSSSHQHAIPFNPLQMQSNQLVVALPPEASSHHSHHAPGRSGGGSQSFLPEPPPPYPGHPPPLPSRPSNTSVPVRPNLPSAAAITGPSHGYGEGRGHYNRRSTTTATTSGGGATVASVVYPAAVPSSAGNSSKSAGSKGSKSGHRWTSLSPSSQFFSS